MPDSKTLPIAEPKSQSQLRLACELRHKEVVGRRGPLTNMGELELKNVSSDPLDIWYQMSPLQYLDFVVIGPNETVLSKERFGDQFSPMEEEKVVRLGPGEKAAWQVPLIVTIPQEDRKPGVYKVHAIYKYDGIRAESNQLEVTV